MGKIGRSWDERERLSEVNGCGKEAGKEGNGKVKKKRRKERKGGREGRKRRSTKNEIRHFCQIVAKMQCNIILYRLFNEM